MRNPILFLIVLVSLSGCELYADPDEADDAVAAPDAPAQCQQLVDTLCSAAVRCGYATDTLACAEGFPQCETNQTVVAPGYLIALDTRIDALACGEPGTPWWVWLDRDDATAVLDAMLRWPA